MYFCSATKGDRSKNKNIRNESRTYKTFSFNIYIISKIFNQNINLDGEFYLTLTQGKNKQAE